MKQVMLVLATLALTGAGGRADAGMVLDQQNLLNTSGGFAIFSIGPDLSGDYHQRAQTFTVGVAGMLSRIDVETNTEAGSVPLVFDLYPTIAGVPDPTTSLAHFTFAPASVSSPFDFGHVFTIDLGASAFPVLPGDMFAIALSVTGTTITDEYGWITGSNVYTGGEEFDRVLPSGNFVSSSSDPSIGVSLDSGFQTFVDVPSVTAAPEPASLTLLAISAVCSLGYGWRRRMIAFSPSMVNRMR